MYFALYTALHDSVKLYYKNVCISVGNEKPFGFSVVCKILCVNLHYQLLFKNCNVLDLFYKMTEWRNLPHQNESENFTDDVSAYSPSKQQRTNEYVKATIDDTDIILLR